MTAANRKLTTANKNPTADLAQGEGWLQAAVARPCRHVAPAVSQLREDLQLETANYPVGWNSGSCYSVRSRVCVAHTLSKRRSGADCNVLHQAATRTVSGW